MQLRCSPLRWGLPTRPAGRDPTGEDRLYRRLNDPASLLSFSGGTPSMEFVLLSLIVMPLAVRVGLRTTDLARSGCLAFR